MPIYEYKCKSCDETFESYRGLMARDSDVKCPKCGSADPQRVLSTFFGQNSSGQSCGPRLSRG